MLGIKKVEKAIPELFPIMAKEMAEYEALLNQISTKQIQDTYGVLWDSSFFDESTTICFS